MSVNGKSSLKRGKPSYIYSTIGVALVLLILGIMGWIFLNFQEVAKVFKEEVPISAYLRTQKKDTIYQIQDYISKQPYALSVRYIDKETAKQIWNKDNNEDWAKTLSENPLPECIDFRVKANYVNKDSLKAIQNDLVQKWGSQLTEVQYQWNLVTQLDENAGKIGLVFIVIAVILVIIVIISIDNTIRLAMFSNRFLIKTMQMVGATRWFITKPMDIKAIIHGLVSSLVAILLLLGIIQWAESQFPELGNLHNNQMLLVLFAIMMVIGIGISLLSTHRSVLKYLKMKLDDLY